SVSFSGSVDNAALAEMQMRKLAVGVGEVYPDRLRRLRPAASDLRLLVFEAADDVDARSVFAACDRVDDWLAAALGYARHRQPRLAAFDVDMEVDRQEHRRMQLLERRGEH